MRFPLSLYLSLGRYVLCQRIRGNRRFPLVLMMEPLHACNLACEGCGRIREYEATIRDVVPMEPLLQAADECPAPVVSVCGGEPTMYGDLVGLIEGLQARRRHVYLCTNGLLLPQFFDDLKPTSRLFFNVHLDGLRETHDAVVVRSGTFDRAIEAIREAKRRGFWVCTNTTVFRETMLDEIETLFTQLEELGVDGLLISPGFAYKEIDGEMCLTREEVHARFRELIHRLSRHRLWNSRLYLDFLAGERHLDCSPWGNPTFTPQGWRGPCYLISDGHWDSYQEMMDAIDWPRFERRQDPRCRDCMMHCGAEPTATIESSRNVRDAIRMLRWSLVGT
jgi:hopanoid biosynthesis associated radical SAM protein HpnH